MKNFKLYLAVFILFVFSSCENNDGLLSNQSLDLNEFNTHDRIFSRGSGNHRSTGGIGPRVGVIIAELRSYTELGDFTNDNEDAYLRGERGVTMQFGLLRTTGEKFVQSYPIVATPKRFQFDPTHTQISWKALPTGKYTGSLRFYETANPDSYWDVDYEVVKHKHNFTPEAVGNYVMRVSYDNYLHTDTEGNPSGPRQSFLMVSIE